MHDQTIIGLCGAIGSGKTTVARRLVNHGWVRHRFADPLKSMLAALGLNESQLDGHLKEEPSKLICGRTPRVAMQTLGTEWGRNEMGPDIWVNAWEHKLPGNRNVVADDVRFPNEAKIIKELGGKIIRIVRARPFPLSDHISEKHELLEDRLILNDGSVPQLYAKIDGLLAEIMEAS